MIRNIENNSFLDPQKYEGLNGIWIWGHGVYFDTVREAELDRDLNLERGYEYKLEGRPCQNKVYWKYNRKSYLEERKAHNPSYAPTPHIAGSNFIFTDFGQLDESKRMEVTYYIQSDLQGCKDKGFEQTRGFIFSAKYPLDYAYSHSDELINGKQTK